MKRTMGSNAYTRIAERYRVATSDEQAIEEFFLKVAPTFSREEREAILAELRDDEIAAAPTFEKTGLPAEVPTFSIDDAPQVRRPDWLTQLLGELSAAVEERVTQRRALLNAI